MLGLSLIVLIIVFASYLIISRFYEWAAVIAMGAVALLIAIGETIGFFTLKNAQNSVNLGVLAMMVCLGVFTDVVARSRFFDYCGVKLCRKTKAQPLKLLIIFNLFTYVVSLILNNLTVVYAIFPLALLLARYVGFEKRYFKLLAISIIISSNVGGASTAIGDAPNQIIAITQGIPFTDFLWAMTPVNFLSEMVFLFMVSYIFRRYQRQVRSMNAPDRAEAMLAGDLTSRIIAFDYRSTKIDKKFATPSAITAALMIVGFVLSGVLSFPLPLVALVGAVMTLVFIPNGHEFIRSAKIKDVLLMSCLFAMAGAVQATGMIKYIGNLIPKVAKGNSLIAMDLLIILAGVMTALCSAGPTAATLVPLAASFVQITPSYPNLPFFAMSFGVLAGSSASLYAATAGPIVASRMEEIAGVPLGFWDFLKIGWKTFLVFELIAICFVSVWIILTG